MTTTIDDCRLLDFPRITSREGSITPLEETSSVPFSIARIFYIYDVPGGASRGGHAHRDVEQLIVSVMSSFDVVLDDGHNRRVVTLNRAYYGLYVPKLIWSELVNFSSGAVCLVLASDLYSEDDYFRRYEEFLRFKTGAP
ncbi:MAG TPA: FdtA/QdtA family cupin domain-containing protein [Thermoanaerobaculia bacterium]|nr:FdtA/QdtA family cupin domain-containing protein [Thermoanaerobaculia bacterium]